MTETLIRPDDTTTTAWPLIFDIIYIPRKDCIEGCLALIYNKRLNTKLKPSYSFNIIECSDFILENRNGLCNRVTCHTHRLGNTIDLIITTEHLMSVSSILQGRLFSNNHIVHCYLSAGNNLTDSKFCSDRKIKKANPIVFDNDVSSLLQELQIDDLSAQDACDLSHSVLKNTFDTYAPLKTKRVSDHPKLPWFNDDLGKAIRYRWKAERVWCHDKSNTDNYIHFYRARRDYLIS